MAYRRPFFLLYGLSSGLISPDINSPRLGPSAINAFLFEGKVLRQRKAQNSGVRLVDS